MYKKVTLIAMVFALMLAGGAVNVFAAGNATTHQCPPMYNADSNTTTDAYFCDGRLNAYDLTESVAVYYAYASVPVFNVVTQTQQMTNVVGAINIWSIDGDGVGQLALSVPASQIDPAFSATAPTQIAAANGVTLMYTPATHMFMVSGPRGYSFSWLAW